MLQNFFFNELSIRNSPKHRILNLSGPKHREGFEFRHVLTPTHLQIVDLAVVKETRAGSFHENMAIVYYPRPQSKLSARSQEHQSRDHKTDNNSIGK
jgi:hypothetical protein